MSLLDKVVSTVMPPESGAARGKAREEALSAAEPGSWLAMVLEHHREIERTFEAVEVADTGMTDKASPRDHGAPDPALRGEFSRYMGDDTRESIMKSAGTDMRH